MKDGRMRLTIPKFFCEKANIVEDTEFKESFFEGFIRLTQKQLVKKIGGF